MTQRDPLDIICQDGDRIVFAEELTCFDCEHREECEYVDDPYNTGGDCLAAK